tara:strand:+ start:2633 stop:3361 length:729 start_codon:yes stop_codon:yes gene_type:complete
MNDVSFEELLLLGAERRMEGIYTSMPCIITHIPNGLRDMRIDVQPAINVDYAGEDDEHTQILGVPLIFPSSKTAMLSFPLAVGDTVFCSFSQRAMDNFKQGTGQPTVVADLRMFDVQDAVAIPGLFPFSESRNDQSKRSWPHNTADTVLATNLGTGTEVEIRMTPGGVLTINTNQTVNVNCTTANITASNMKVDVQNTVWSGNMTFNGDITQNGTYTLDGIVMNSHVHSGIQSGPSKTAGPE